MANKKLKSIKFPGLPDVYTIPEGGAEPFYVNIEVTVTGNDRTYSCNRTYDEIVAAEEAGKQLVAIIPFYLDQHMTWGKIIATDHMTIGTDELFSPKRVLFYTMMDNDNPDVFTINAVYASIMEYQDRVSVGKVALQRELKVNGIVKGAVDVLGEATYSAAAPNTDYKTPSMGASGAKVGQMLKVKTVNASGDPTAWETGDPEAGITPTIGENGNWYLGTEDTGKPSRGATGAKGDKGDKGDPGAQGPKGETGAVDITALSQSEYEAASAAGTLDEGKWYGVYPDA